MGLRERLKRLEDREPRQEPGVPSESPEEMAERVRRFAPLAAEFDYLRECTSEEASS